MKKMMVVVMVLALAGMSVAAEGEATGNIFGARVGYSFSPDQFFFGGHMDMGQVFAPMRLVPNLEIGFGNDLTTVALNGDLIYDFPETAFGVGGELGFVYSNWDDHGLNDIDGVDVDTSDTDVSLSVLGEYRHSLSNGKTMFGQLKFGLSGTADFKVLVGYNF